MMTARVITTILRLRWPRHFEGAVSVVVLQENEVLPERDYAAELGMGITIYFAVVCGTGIGS